MFVKLKDFAEMNQSSQLCRVSNFYLFRSFMGARQRSHGSSPRDCGLLFAIEDNLKLCSACPQSKNFLSYAPMGVLFCQSLFQPIYGINRFAFYVHSSSSRVLDVMHDTCGVPVKFLTGHDLVGPLSGF